MNLYGEKFHEPFPEVEKICYIYLLEQERYQRSQREIRQVGRR